MIAGAPTRTRMPRFPDPPRVFPPVVPPAGPTGDWPVFACARDGVMMAWSPPDEFLFADEERPVSFTDGDSFLRATMLHRWRADAHEAAAAVQADLDDQIQRTRRALDTLGVPNIV